MAEIKMRGTTILSVRRGDKVVVAGDGQVARCVAELRVVPHSSDVILRMRKK